MRAASSIRKLLRVLLVIAAVGAVLVPVGTAFAATGGDAHGDDHGGHAEKSPVEDHNVQLVVWSLITFVIFLFVLKAAAWKPLIQGLDNREANYVKLLGDAEADRDRALKMLGEYEQKLKAAQAEVDEIIAEARRDAERTKTDIISAANAEAEATRTRALDDIDRARDQALSSIFEHMHGNVLAATEKVLARSLSDDDHQRLIDEALAEVSAN